MRENRAAFERVRFDPRWLTDVSQREIATTVLGERVAMPVILAPAGLARLVHPEGELAVARAAGAAGTIFCVSTASSYSLEEIADVASGPLWLQLYLWRSSEVVAGSRPSARGPRATRRSSSRSTSPWSATASATCGTAPRCRPASTWTRRSTRCGGRAGSSTSSAAPRSPSPTSPRSSARATPARSAPTSTAS